MWHTLALGAAGATSGGGLDAGLPAFAPTGALGIVLACLAFVADQYRRAKSYQADRYRSEAQELVKQLNDAQDQIAAGVAREEATKHDLGDRITKLEQQMQQMRESNARQVNELQDRLTRENAATHRHLELEMRVGWRLREWMAQHQWPLPPDLDPERPDVPPQLGASDPGSAGPQVQTDDGGQE